MVRYKTANTNGEGFGDEILVMVNFTNWGDKREQEAMSAEIAARSGQ